MENQLLRAKPSQGRSRPEKPALFPSPTCVRELVLRQVYAHNGAVPRHSNSLASSASVLLLAALVVMVTTPARAVILWSDTASRVIHATDAGVDILGGAVKRDNTASDALYFKLKVDPLSDVANEPYFAVFQLFEGDEPRLAVGNAPDAWGYSACFTSETGPSNRVAGEFDLKSSKPEATGLGVFKPYELPSHNHERTIIFKVQYIPGGDDLITVWLSPNVS